MLLMLFYSNIRFWCIIRWLRSIKRNIIPMFVFIGIINVNSFIAALIPIIGFVPIEMNQIWIILEMSSIFKTIFLAKLCEFFYQISFLLIICFC